MPLKNKIIILSLALFLFAGGVSAESLGERRIFYVDQSYDVEGRGSINAVLVLSGYKVNIYADESWWNFTDKKKSQAALDALNVEFNSKIYTVLTSTFGQEWTPGIDKDSKITILIQSMKDDAGGYFRTNDEYSKFQASDSNEREMIYINSKRVLDQNLKAFVAHELMHLITFNQKNQKFNVEEDVWLNEARAEYAPTLLGYNDVYEGSYLEKRVQNFSEKPNGPLAYWQDAKSDYGRVCMFVHYLVDQYGIDVLIDSLQSDKTGIESINYALQKNGFKTNLLSIFSDWTLAVLVNDCDYGEKYCYLNKSLENFYLLPSVNFLPVSGNTTLSFSDSIKAWSGNWYKLIGGGGGTLKFDFQGDPKASFKVAYIKKNKAGVSIIDFMDLNAAQKGELSIENFGKDITSLIVVPVIQDSSGSAGGIAHDLSWSAAITRQQPGQNNDAEIQRLLAVIENLKQQIAALLGQQGGSQTACLVNSNLGLGSRGEEVKCLQQFLKGQGVGIYPEGLVTGNFGALTKQAVIRFQEKYASEILVPSGLSAGTGYVGLKTRQKITKML